MIDLMQLAKSRRRFQMIPKDLGANLRFRRDLLMKCHTSKEWQRAIFETCKEDPLFFFSGLCWVYEPRKRFHRGIELPNQIPFIAWDHQIPAILEIYENLGSCDIGVEKSRGEGLSWIGVLLASHDFIFNDMVSVGFVSKDEVSVDDPRNPDSLFWKLDFTLEVLPDWLSGVKGKDFIRDIAKHTLFNKRNGSSITGYSATGNVASGGRKKWFLKDELAKFPKPDDRNAMASTQHVTESRLIVSTPLGSEGAYFDAMHSPTNMVKIIVDWKQNPVRNRGLYEWKDGIPVAVDMKNNPLPPEYDPPNSEVLDMISRLRRRGFRIEGRVRSPWYDRECDRVGATPQNIAQELDRDYGGSAWRVFGDAFFKKITSALQAPVHVGDLNFSMEKIDNIRFDDIENGPMKLWVPLDSLGNPPVKPYCIGCDVSSGTGGAYTSNSTICVMDMISQEQVLEYARNTIPPMEFADLAIAVAKWFNNAILGWEHNGPGAQFTKRVINREYTNIYYRRSLDRYGGGTTKSAGWWTDERSKEVMFGEFENAVITSQLTIRSHEMKTECGRYVRKDGKITNELLKGAVDDSKGASHGDRTIAGCVMLQAAKERPVTSTEEAYMSIDPPMGSMAYRMKEYENAKKRREDDDWGDGIFEESATGDSFW